jgi:hypothetical protein
MLASPIGTVASVVTRLVGGSQQSQDFALELGSAAEVIATASAGARAENTDFLNTQTGEGMERGPLDVGENLGAPKTASRQAA